MALRDLLIRRTLLSASVLITAAILVAVIALAAHGLFWRESPATEPDPGANPTMDPELTAPAPSPPQQTAMGAGAAQSRAPPSGSTQPSGEAGEDSSAPFKADAAGALVTDEQTRLNIERLVALNTPQETQQKLQEITQTLPPAAAQRLADLVERYVTYSEAARQTFPPGVAPSSEEDALTQIATLHALRAQHFGPETAAVLFGAEEETQRKLLDLMRLEKNSSLTLQQRAEKAQSAYDR